jgi:hypothetical protein
VKIAHRIGRIENGDRPGFGQIVDQRVALWRGQRMAKRLEQCRPACIIARTPTMGEVGILEGFNGKRRHAFTQ